MGHVFSVYLRLVFFKNQKVAKKKKKESQERLILNKKKLAWNSEILKATTQQAKKKGKITLKPLGRVRYFDRIVWGKSVSTAEFLRRGMSLI